MFHSVPRRQICEMGVNTVRFQCNRSFRRTVKEGKEKLEKVSWLGSGMELLFAWMQRASVGASEAAGSGPKRKGLLSIFADHCSFVTGQRLRRACQIGELYSNLYSERTRRTLVGSIWRRFQSKHAPSGKLVAAMAGLFMWDKEKIQDEEIRRFELCPQRHTWLCFVKTHYCIWQDNLIKLDVYQMLTRLLGINGSKHLNALLKLYKYFVLNGCVL